MAVNFEKARADCEATEQSLRDALDALCIEVCAWAEALAGELARRAQAVIDALMHAWGHAITDEHTIAEALDWLDRARETHLTRLGHDPHRVVPFAQHADVTSVAFGSADAVIDYCRCPDQLARLRWWGSPWVGLAVNEAGARTARCVQRNSTVRGFRSELVAGRVPGVERLPGHDTNDLLAVPRRQLRALEDAKRRLATEIRRPRSAPGSTTSLRPGRSRGGGNDRDQQPLALARGEPGSEIHAPMVILFGLVTSPINDPQQVLGAGVDATFGLVSTSSSRGR